MPACERRIPGHDLIVVARRIVAQRLRQPSLIFQPMIGSLPQAEDAVARKERRIDPLDGRLPCHGLRVVLAEFEGRGLLEVGPCAARAIESVGLIVLEQGLDALHQHVLPLERLGDCLERALAAGRFVIVADAIRPFFSHALRLPKRQRVSCIPPTELNLWEPTAVRRSATIPRAKPSYYWPVGPRHSSSPGRRSIGLVGVPERPLRTIAPRSP